jgi:hypothetical protein
VASDLANPGIVDNHLTGPHRLQSARVTPVQSGEVLPHRISLAGGASLEARQFDGTDEIREPRHLTPHARTMTMSPCPEPDNTRFTADGPQIELVLSTWRQNCERGAVLPRTNKASVQLVLLASCGGKRWVVEDAGSVLDELDAAVEGSAFNHVERDVGVAVVDAF